MLWCQRYQHTKLKPPDASGSGEEGLCCLDQHLQLLLAAWHFELIEVYTSTLQSQIVSLKQARLWGILSATVGHKSLRFSSEWQGQIHCISLQWLSGIDCATLCLSCSTLCSESVLHARSGSTDEMSHLLETAVTN